MATIELGFDPDLVRQELDEEGWMDAIDWSPGCDAGQVRSIYLGTVFALTPSGKYYMPWACSNLDACEQCDGKGSKPNPTVDNLHHEHYRQIRSYITAHCLDTFGAFPDWPMRLRAAALSCDNGKSYTKPERICVHCGGLGSREAYLDQLWQEKAESLHESHGFMVESGEGDPCDLFAVEYRDND